MWKQTEHTQFQLPNRISQIKDWEKEGVPDAGFVVLSSGRAIPLQKYHGKIVLLHFWASWCAPCLVELPELRELAGKVSGLVILAVSLDDTKELAERFVKKVMPNSPNNFIYMYPQDLSLVKKVYSIDRLPETLLLGKDGNLLKRVIGSEKWMSSPILSYFQSISKN